MTAITAVSDCWSFSTTGTSQSGAPHRSLKRSARPSPMTTAMASLCEDRTVLSGDRPGLPKQVESDDLAGRVAVDQIAAQRVDFQSDHRPRQPGAPADVAGRIHHGQLTLERRGRDGPAGKVGDRMRDRSARGGRILRCVLASR